MTKINDQIMAEFIEEEIATITALIDRHSRWRALAESSERSKQNHIISDILKEAIEANQVLIDILNKI